MATSRSPECLLLRKYFSKLKESMLTPSVIADELFSLEFIDEHARKKSLDKDNGSDELLCALTALFLNLDEIDERAGKFKEVLEIFKKCIPLDKVAEKIEKEYSKMLDTKMGGGLSKHANDFIVEVKKISDLKNQTYKLDMIQQGIELYIKQSLEDGIKEDELEKELYELLERGHIPSECNINSSCFSKLQELVQLQTNIDETSTCTLDANVADTSIEEAGDDLFSKSNIYHAVLCCLAVTSTDQDDVNVALSLEPNGHTFDAMSRSRSMDKSLRICVAEQGEIVYIAFQGETNLTSWVKCTDIDEELECQLMDSFPLKLMVELLNKKKQLILTGFSFGGILARCLNAKLWDSELLSSTDLLQNVACITFGIPLIPVAHIQKMGKKYPRLQETFYSFFLNDDMLPTLLSFGVNSEENRKAWKLHCFCLNVLMEKNSDDPLYTKALEALSESINKLPDDNDDATSMHAGQAFMISDKQYKALQNLGEALCNSKDLLQSAISDGKIIINQHIMKNYLHKITHGYLSKNQAFAVPQRKHVGLITPVEFLKPSIIIDKGFVHKHILPDGFQVTVTIMGDNLWFCNSINIEFKGVPQLKLEANVNAENVSAKQIQCSHSLDTDINGSNGQITIDVIVCSHFAATIKKTVQASYIESDPISFRQGQLAKLTPSDVIVASFLSALLEQAPIGATKARPSKRHQMIMKFIEGAANIVPLESIFMAIACCTIKDPIFKCAEMVIDAYDKKGLPTVSKLMAQFCMQASGTLFSTLPPEDIVYPENMFNPFQRPARQKSYSEAAKPTTPKKSDGKQQSAVEKQLKHVSKFPPLYNHPDVNYRQIVVTQFFRQLTKELYEEACKLEAKKCLKLICGKNICEIYPFTYDPSFTSSIPIEPILTILQNAREKIIAESSKQFESETQLGSRANHNVAILQYMQELIYLHLQPCIVMLGGFMEQQMRVPLVNNPLDTALALNTTDSSRAVGVWALFALDRDEIEHAVTKSKNKSLVIQINKYIRGVLGSRTHRANSPELSDSKYAGKLQFILELAKNQTVTCSHNYISYSLERELAKLCKQFNITASTAIDDIIDEWDRKFRATALSLVPKTYRPLLARWIVWALYIYNLREGLAQYTTVGVIGLVNSGKSTLVNALFQRKTLAGTTQAARTTVPFLYNMEDIVKGLGVIDFPGMAERDTSVFGLVKVLVNLAQVAIVLCNYEKFHTEIATQWFRILHELSSTPVLICLTHADMLYLECCGKDAIPDCPHDRAQSLKQSLEEEKKKILGNTEIPKNCEVKFCSLTQEHLPIDNEEGRSSLRRVGILTPWDIGIWIKEILESRLQQHELAQRLADYMDAKKIV